MLEATLCSHGGTLGVDWLQLPWPQRLEVWPFFQSMGMWGKDCHMQTPTWFWQPFSMGKCMQSILSLQDILTFRQESSGIGWR